MARERVRRSEPCAEDGCGSKRFYIDDDGYTYCERGHRQSQHGTVVTTETGELQQKGTRHRRIDSEAESIATSRSGLTRSQAQEHYLLCLQLVLRKQCSWLVMHKGLPPQLESLVKDLWALRLQHLRRLPEEDTQTDEEQSRTYSSQTEADTTDAEDAHPDDAKDKLVGVMDTVALLHITMIVLRLPISTADLCSWINDGRLLYYFSAKAVPADLLRKLPAYMQQRLEPSAVIKGQNLQAAVMSTLKSFDAYGVRTPCINHTILLYRWLKLMALPIEVFPATRRLAALLHDDFSFGDPKRSPETRLMAFVVVSTKLLFPVDDTDRVPSSLSTLRIDWAAWCSSFSVRRTDDLVFLDALMADEEKCTEMGNAQLDQYLDWYHDNVASDYVNDRGRAAREADFRRVIQLMFPANRSVDHSATVDVLASSPPSKTISDEDVLRSSEVQITNRLRQSQQLLAPKTLAPKTMPTLGSFYRRYRTLDDLLTATPALAKLYELAAQHSGVAPKLIVRAVYEVEKQLERIDSTNDELV